MSEQYIRRLQLIVAGTKIELTGAPDARDDAGLRVRFSIRDATTQTPRTAEIRITNLSDPTAQRMLSASRQRGAPVELNAGYRDNFGRIFKGEIRQVRIGRETPTDTYVDIFAATGDRAYNSSVINRTLPAGSTPKDIYTACLTAMKPFGIVQGQIPDALSKMKYPTPIVLYGMARDYLRTLTQSNGCTWNIRDDKLDVIPKDGALEGGAVVLNSRTGLIGLPTQTELGIVARCLINPRVHVNATVQIDQKSIQQAAQNLSYGGERFNAEPYLPSLAADGMYRVLSLDCVGDTHGQPWYYELACMARSGVIPGAQASLGRGGTGPIAPADAYLGRN